MDYKYLYETNQAVKFLMEDAKMDKYLDDMKSIIDKYISDYPVSLKTISTLDAYLDNTNKNNIDRIPLLKQQLNDYVKKNRIDTDILKDYWMK